MTVSKDPLPSEEVRTERRTLLVRRLAAVVSAVVAGLYVLLAGGIVEVRNVDPAAASPTPIFAAAAVMFAFGAFALWRYANHLLWAGTAFVLAILAVMYVEIADHRLPAYETVGVTLHVLQIAIYVAMLYLMLMRGLARRDRATR